VVHIFSHRFVDLLLLLLLLLLRLMLLWGLDSAAPRLVPDDRRVDLAIPSHE